ncbi:MAG: DUF2868 domain-containing protein [Halioglobus sp.]
MSERRTRDHAIGLKCKSTDDVGRLVFWAQQQSTKDEEGSGLADHYQAEATLSLLLRGGALLAGIAAMIGFLSSSVEGRVNVSIFMAIFVALQFVFCVFSLGVMYRSVRGSPPVVLPTNPAKYMLFRIFPDKKFFREFWSVVRILLLRYSQEIGALFTIGALVAVLSNPGFKDFDYVWESDYDIPLKGIVDALAAPWSWIYPGIEVSTKTIAESRYRPNSTISGDNSEWRAFLIMAMFLYALLPRLLLWVLSRHYYSRALCSAIVWCPGAQGILMRMKATVVSTQAVGEKLTQPSGSAFENLDKKLVLVDWAGALDSVNTLCLDELKSVPAENVVSVGLGSLVSEKISAMRIIDLAPSMLFVAVKAWEPPMADLRDFLSELEGVKRCTLCLLSLPGKSLNDSNIDDWKVFSRKIDIDLVNVTELESSRFN